MLIAGIFLALLIMMCFALQNLLASWIVKEKASYGRIKRDYDNLTLEHGRLKGDHLILETNLNQTMALYDITKEICSSLEVEAVFNAFRENISKYVEVRECKLARDVSDLSGQGRYITMPLKIDSMQLGCLAVDLAKPQDNDKFYILAHQLALGLRRAALYQKIQELSITDHLTGVFTRRYLLQRLNEELTRSKSLNYKFSFLMADIDFFKSYNDHYGHLVGDAILKEAAKGIRENIRQVDLAGRYGGEEFCVILTETDKPEANFAAERIRRAVEARQVKVYDEELKITLSIGIATYPADGEGPLEIIDKADAALYRAKEAGRNRVSS